ncbi:MAG TPA: hypothetical protein VLA83_16740 [Candidatus Binatia bacterium]|nr:hypothetical protein [Candidatus Binatia bacterium]
MLHSEKLRGQENDAPACRAQVDLFAFDCRPSIEALEALNPSGLHNTPRRCLADHGCCSPATVYISDTLDREWSSSIAPITVGARRSNRLGLGESDGGQPFCIQPAIVTGALIKGRNLTLTPPEKCIVMVLPLPCDETARTVGASAADPGLWIKVIVYTHITNASDAAIAIPLRFGTSEKASVILG